MHQADVNSSDDDDNYDNVQRPRQIVKKWDVFQDVPPSEESGSSVDQRGFDVAIKIVKVFAYVVTFGLVLGGAVAAKGSLLFMTSQLRRNATVTYCNREIGHNKRFISEVTDDDRISWLWIIFYSFLATELGTFFRSIRICFFKTFDKPEKKEFLVVFLMETLHTAGLALLAFVVLPDLDAVKGVMLTNCACFVPALLGLLSRGNEEATIPKDQRTNLWRLKMIVDGAAVLFQASGLVVWPILHGGKAWYIPVCVLLISCGWWENYVTLPRDTNSKSLQSLRKFMLRLTDPRYRYYTYIYISAWKMIFFFCAMLLAVYQQQPTKDPSVPLMFSDFLPSFQARKVTVVEVQPIMTSTTNMSSVMPKASTIEMDASPMTPVWVLVVHVVSAYFCYIFAKFACKIRIQQAGLAFPLNLAVPVTVTLLVAACGLRNSDPCYFHGFIPDYMSFAAPDIFNLQAYVLDQNVWVWLLWLVSQMWVTVHLWVPQADALASTDRLFVTPLYNSLVVDQSIAMNRRRNDKDVSVRREDMSDISNEYDMLDEDEIVDAEHATKSNVEFMTQTLQSPHVKPMDYITRIYACATMWHETYDEMTCMIMSLLRMDADQAVRKYMQQHLDLVDPNYYEFETHILFDDAFMTTKEGERVVNTWVKTFMKCMEDTVDTFHGVRLQPPTTIPTPYGGRLVWALPGKNKIHVHLKDKNKIRHRKRWSQVMYMYYLLGHRIMELPIHIDRKAVIGQNTYILAMDGDIDFQPQAVHLLIDLMKKNDTLGSSCGRIHPVGSGAMSWYQKFEYAIGHWLQKATEHMIGCVLCSPGAFSLFRARALMDQGVMKRYTFTATEPRHYVQYDQGEDRWLCTLLLQQGYRVEYSAASDAYTHCPESFNEFYNQRRRWVPSTMANILDLLASYKQTIKVNDNISAPYIFYHVIMMAGSILGPGTIFLMLVGAFVSAFKIGNYESLQYNLIPLLIFLLCCGLFSSKVQLFVAMVISSVYGLVMMAVVVAIAIQIKQDGVTAPSSIFFFMFIGELVIAAFLHPKEIGCLPAILIYYVTVPSMYMLLIIYSLFNMNDITWGTRDSAPVGQAGKTKKQLEEEKKAQEELMKKNKKKTPLLGFLRGDEKGDEVDGSIEFSLAGLFRCMCCTHPKVAEDKQHLSRIGQSLDALDKKLDALERRINPAAISPRQRNSISINGQIMARNEYTDDQEASYTESLDGMNEIKRDDMINPYWISALDIKGTVHFLNDNEVDFWKGLIEKYLFPLDENLAEQKKIAKGLKELRNKTVFTFLMMNALFVIVIFLLQINQDTMHLQWPLGVTNTISYNTTAKEVHIVKSYLSLEPIGIVFVAFFAVVLVVQFVGMLMHRFSTLSHLLASTTVTCGSKDDIDLNEGIIREELIDYMKKFKLHDVNNPVDDKTESTMQRVKRSTIHKLLPKAQGEHIAETIDAGLTHAFDNIDKFAGKPKFTGRRDTLKVIAERRSTVAHIRQSQVAQRASQMSLGARPSHLSQGRPSRVSLQQQQQQQQLPKQVTFVNRGYEPTEPSEMV